MASYIGIAPPTQTGIVNRYQYTGDGSTVLFSGNDDNGAELRYTSTNPILVYLNGVQLLEGTDYTKTSNTSVTFASAPALNDTIEILTFGSFDLNAPSTLRTDLGIELSSGEILYGNASNETGKYALSGTSNEIEINTTSNTITLGLPDDVTIGNDLTVTEKLKINTTTQLGRLTISGSNDYDDGPVLWLHGNAANQQNSGTIRLTEDNASMQGAWISYNGSGNRLLLGTHATGDFTTSNDITHISMSRGSGFVGINIGDANPAYPLVVGNNEGIQDAAIEIKGIRPYLVYTDTGDSTYVTQQLNGSTFTHNQSGNIQYQITQDTSTRFYYNAIVDGDLTVDTDTLYVDSTNNRVGIGTTTPSKTLHIVGSGGSSGAAFSSDITTVIENDGDAGLQILSSDSNLSRIRLGSVSDSSSTIIAFNPSDDGMQIGTSTTSGHVKFYSSNFQEAMRIDSSGNVGIGTISPSTALDVSGTVTATTFSGSGASLTSIPNSALANSSITIAGDSGSDSVSLGETLTIAGGTGIDTTGSSNTITVAIDSSVTTNTGTQTLTNKTIDTANNTITISESDISDLGSYIENVVEDTTPQLGGNLDLNSSDITGTGNINISGSGTFSGDLTVDTNTLYANSTNNLVGIRTSSPAAGLDIATTANNGRALQLRSGDGSTSTDSSQIIFSYDGNSYVSGGYAHSIRTRHNSNSGSNNSIDFWLWDQTTDTSSTLGSLRVMTIEGEDGGKVGIGTPNPERSLHISQSVPIIRGTDTDTSSYGEVSFSGGSVDIRADEGNAVAGSYIVFRNDGSEIARFDDSGQLGIGTNTPSSLLHLSTSTFDGIHIDGSAGTYLKLDRGFTSNGAELTFQTAGTTNFSIGLDNNNTNNFYIGDNNLANKYLTILTSNGFVGINNTSPVARLDVEHTAADVASFIRDNNAGAGQIRLGNSDGYVRIGGANGSFTVYNSTNTSARLYIDNTGKVGIGNNASPSVELDVTGDGAFSGDVTITGDLTVNGTTTTLNTTNTTITDNLLELNSGATSNANDSGFIIERGSTGDNAIFMWDESADVFTLGTTTATASDTGNLTITVAELVANIDGSNSTISNIGNSSLTNSDITFAGDSGSDSAALGETLTVSGGTGISTAITSNTVTITGDDATTSTKGIASFNSSEFSVSSGAVSINSIDASKIADGSVSNTEFQYLANVTGDIQNQLDGKASNGFAIAMSIAL